MPLRSLFAWALPTVPALAGFTGAVLLSDPTWVAPETSERPPAHASAAASAALGLASLELESPAAESHAAHRNGFDLESDTADTRRSLELEPYRPDVDRHATSF